MKEGTRDPLEASAIFPESTRNVGDVMRELAVDAATVSFHEVRARLLRRSYGDNNETLTVVVHNIGIGVICPNVFHFPVGWCPTLAGDGDNYTEEVIMDINDIQSLQDR